VTAVPSEAGDLSANLAGWIIDLELTADPRQVFTLILLMPVAC
jgi:hypothetical protein